MSHTDGLQNTWHATPVRCSSLGKKSGYKTLAVKLDCTATGSSVNTKRQSDSLSSGRPHPDTGGKPKVPITENAIRDLNEAAKRAQSDPLKTSKTAPKSGAPSPARSSAISEPSTSASTGKSSANASVSGEAKPAAAAAPKAAASAAPAKPAIGASSASNSKASKKAQ